MYNSIVIVSVYSVCHIFIGYMSQLSVYYKHVVQAHYTLYMQNLTSFAALNILGLFGYSTVQSSFIIIHIFTQQTAAVHISFVFSFMVIKEKNPLVTHLQMGKRMAAASISILFNINRNGKNPSYCFLGHLLLHK